MYSYAWEAATQCSIKSQRRLATSVGALCVTMSAPAFVCIALRDVQVRKDWMCGSVHSAGDTQKTNVVYPLQPLSMEKSDNFTSQVLDADRINELRGGNPYPNTDNCVSCTKSLQSCSCSCSYATHTLMRPGEIPAIARMGPLDSSESIPEPYPSDTRGGVSPNESPP